MLAIQRMKNCRYLNKQTVVICIRPSWELIVFYFCCFSFKQLLYLLYTVDLSKTKRTQIQLTEKNDPDVKCNFN